MSVAEIKVFSDHGVEGEELVLGSKGSLVGQQSGHGLSSHVSKQRRVGDFGQRDGKSSIHNAVLLLELGQYCFVFR